MPRIKRLIPNHDNNHCFQACFAMVSEALTGVQVSIEQADVLTNYAASRPTWPYKGMLEWAEQGLYVKYVEQFSHEKFIVDPAETIRDHVKDEDIALQVINASDLEKEVILVKACLNHPKIKFETRQPELEDIRCSIMSGGLVVVNVNYYALLGQDKYTGHFVVVERVNSGSLLLQNPGAPPIENQVVSKELFLKAWYFPNANLANMIEVRCQD